MWRSFWQRDGMSKKVLFTQHCVQTTVFSIVLYKQDLYSFSETGRHFMQFNQEHASMD